MFLSIPVAALLVAAVGGLAQAANPKPGSRAVSSEEQAATSDYWTPARRAAAIPKEMRISPSEAGAPMLPAGPPEPVKSVEGGLPKMVGGTAAEESEAWSPENDGQGAAEVAEIEGPQIDPLGLGSYPYAFARYEVLKQLYTGGTRKYPYITVGKLFFTMGGVNYVCSASVIRPHLLLTARHCIFDYSSKTWATNVVFYPGYFNGPNLKLGPANGWLGRTLATWVSNAADLQYDIGFIQTFNRNRTGCSPTATNPQIDSYTGFLGYVYGGSYDNRHFDDFGYPHAAPFNGKTMQQCEAATGVVNSLGITNTVEIGCDQTGGTSGGPWLSSGQGWNRFYPGVAGNFNHAASVNSFRWITPSRPLAINGPQFLQGNFWNLLSFAMGLPC
jgi:V8-like Glu-specific endopeptidase